MVNWAELWPAGITRKFVTASWAGAVLVRVAMRGWAVLPLRKTVAKTADEPSSNWLTGNCKVKMAGIEMALVARARLLVSALSITSLALSTRTANRRLPVSTVIGIAM